MVQKVWADLAPSVARGKLKRNITTTTTTTTTTAATAKKNMSEGEVRHHCINGIDDPGILDTIEGYTYGPYARVEWVDYQSKQGGWLLTNKEVGPRGMYVPSEVVGWLAANPYPQMSFEAEAKLSTETVIKVVDGKDGDMEEKHRLMRHNALERLDKIQEQAGMSHAAKKINWLEDNPYPVDRPRKHWPTWFHQNNRVLWPDIECKDCHARPRQLEMIKMPTWRVYHISDRLDVKIKSTTPNPTKNDQYFQCPHCAETVIVGDDMLMYGMTIMWVARQKRYYYTCPPALEGKHVGRQWIKYITPPKGEEEGTRRLVAPMAKKQKIKKQKKSSNKENNNK